jgi:hypothetical protein
LDFATRSDQASQESATILSAEALRIEFVSFLQACPSTPRERAALDIAPALEEQESLCRRIGNNP